MPLQSLVTRVDELAVELSRFHGFRTLWLDPGGRLIHTEPEDELEARGYRYVATMLRPDRDELTAAVKALAPVNGGSVSWVAPVTAGSNAAFVPA